MATGISQDFQVNFRWLFQVELFVRCRVGHSIDQTSVMQCLLS